VQNVALERLAHATYQRSPIMASPLQFAPFLPCLAKRKEVIRLLSRVRSPINRQVLTWFPELTTVLVSDFLLRWPALERLHGVQRQLQSPRLK